MAPNVLLVRAKSHFGGLEPITRPYSEPHESSLPLISDIFKTHFNIILLSMPKSLKWSLLPFKFSI